MLQSIQLVDIKNFDSESRKTVNTDFLSFTGNNGRIYIGNFYRGFFNYLKVTRIFYFLTLSYEYANLRMRLSTQIYILLSLSSKIC